MEDGRDRPTDRPTDRGRERDEGGEGDLRLSNFPNDATKYKGPGLEVQQTLNRVIFNKKKILNQLRSYESPDSPLSNEI